MSNPVAVLNASAPVTAPIRRQSPALAWPLAMLFSRTVLFLLFQAIIAGILGLRGTPAPFDAAAAWWPLMAPMSGIVCLGLLLGRLRAEGISVRTFVGFDRRHLRADLLATVVIFLVCGPLSMLPNILVARWLYGDAAIVGPLFFRPLPNWAALLSVVAFPLMTGLTELPTYFGYVMPRLRAGWAHKWLPWLVASFWLAAQHCALPLVLDWRFVAWRFLMFLPFALWVGLSLRWRPRLLPYLMVGHVLIDLSTAPLILAAVLH